MWRRVVWYIGTNFSVSHAASAFKVAVSSTLNMETACLCQCQCQCHTMPNVWIMLLMTTQQVSSVASVHAAFDERLACSLYPKDLGHWKKNRSLLTLHVSLQSVDYLQKVTHSGATIAVSYKTNSRKNCRNLTSHSTKYLCQVFRTYLSESREAFVRKGTCFAYY
jgi:hypothetical protein